MASDSSTPKANSDTPVDDIDVGWDDDDASSRPTLTRASPSAPAASTASIPRRAAAAQPTSPAQVRAATRRQATTPPLTSAKQRIQPMTPPAVRSVKPAVKQAVRSATPPAIRATKPAAKAPLAAPRRQAAPPSSLRPVLVPPRPVLVPPRPTPSSRTPKPPSEVAAGSEVLAPASPVPPQHAQEPMRAPPAQVNRVLELTNDIDDPLMEAPALMTADGRVEAWPIAPSVFLESRDSDLDTLRPSQQDLTPALSPEPFRTKTPWKALLAAAIVAFAGVVWIVVRSTGSESDTVAALQPGPRIVAPSRAPTALPRATATPRATGENIAAPVTRRDPPELADSVESAPSGSANTMTVTVRVWPRDAVVFKGRERLGTGEMTVKVVRGTNTTLVAQLDGYMPRIFALDGKYQSVNIALRPAAPSTKSQSDGTTTPAREDEPSEGASKRATTADTDAPSESEPRNPSPPGSTQTTDPM